MDTLGKRLRELRKQSGRKAIDLARVMGITNQAWYGWETDSHVPSLPNLVRISEIFGASLDWIIKGKGNPP